MNALIMTLLKNEQLVLSLVAGVSALALIAAMIAQYGFGMAPCIMCIYQRIPFVIVAILGFAGAVRASFCRPALYMSAVAMAVNVGLAFYHSGIERKWWASAVEGCAVPMVGEGQDLLAQIMAAPAVRCDVIPWADPFFGLSMANYNVLLCLGLLAVCALSLRLSRGTKR